MYIITILILNYNINHLWIHVNKDVIFKKNVEHVTFSQLKEGKFYKCTIKCKLSIEDQSHDGYKPWHQHQRFWPWKIA
jgi:hypothetical protein